MKTLRSIKPRRDRVASLAARALRLNELEAARAWHCLAVGLEELAEKETPKFNDLLAEVRTATVNGKKK